MTKPSILLTLGNTQPVALLGGHEYNPEEPLEHLSKIRCENRGLIRAAIQELRRETLVNLRHLQKLMMAWRTSPMFLLLKEHKLRFLKDFPLVKLLTSEFSFEPTEESAGRSPAWQQIRLRFCPTWDRFFHDTSRRNTLSLQGFLSDYMGYTQEQSEPVCRWVLKTLLKHAEWEIKVAIGGTEGFTDVITHVYTNPAAEGGMYPSVSGSCMRSSAETYYSDGHHPVEVYDTADVGLLWSEDYDGYTTIRALWNIPKNTISRIYGSFSQKSDTLMRESWVAAVSQRLPGIRLDMSNGLVGCRLKRILLDNGEGFVMPYLDGCMNVNDEDNYLRVTYNGKICADRTDGTILFEESEICDRCQHEYNTADMTHDEYGYGALCPDCYSYCENYLVSCERCGQTIDTDCEDYISTDNGNTYCCESCAERDGYHYCCDCEEWVTECDHDEPEEEEEELEAQV